MERQYRRQIEFTDKVLKHLYGVSDPSQLTSEQLLDYAMKMTLAQHREADEFLDELPWKHHRLYEDVELVRSNVLEELIDEIKVALSTARAFDFTAAEIEEAFDLKSEVVEDRWRQEIENSELAGPVALIDLDGVLNPYPGPFLDFVFERTGWRYADMAALEMKDPAVKRQMKHLYRQSGLKRNLPAIPASVLACQTLNEQGYDVVVMSQRPYHLYSRIYADTVHWLRSRYVPYKRLIFVPDKGHRLVVSQLRSKIAFAVDDDPGVVKLLRDLGIKTYYHVPDANYNIFEPGNEQVSSMILIPEVMKGARYEVAT